MEHDGVFYATHPDVYDPSDDSFLLARVVKEHAGKGVRVLEVGCGTGLVGLTAAKAGAEVTLTDANPFAVELAGHNAKENGVTVSAVETDLLAGLTGPFDVVCFNPPYLPTAEDDIVEGPLNLAFDGGLDGNQVVLRFIEQIGVLPSRPGVVLVVHSSLSDPKPMIAAMKKLGYKGEEAAKENFFYETLWVRKFVTA
jgi:release factor glutamine methyltransferase